MQAIKAFLLSTANISYRTNINRMADIPELGPELSSEAVPKGLPKTLLDSLGTDHRDALKNVNLFPQKSLEAVCKAFVENNPAINRNDFKDPSATSRSGYVRDSMDSAMQHMYYMQTLVHITGASKAVDKKGAFALKDISTFPGWKGIIFMSDPKQKALVDKYIACKTDAEREKVIKDELEPLARENFEYSLKHGRAPEAGDIFLMDKSLTEFCGQTWISFINHEGKLIEGYAMLLKPGEVHSFAGYIVHGYLITGPNTVTPFVIGGGHSNVPGLDYVNSYVAPVMWSVTKFTAAARTDFEILKASGAIAADVKWEDYFFEKHPELVKWWKAIKFVVGEGGKIGIFLNRFLGRPIPFPMTTQQYLEIRALEKDAKGDLDLDKPLSYHPWGELDYTGTELKEPVGDKNDGILFDGKRIDDGFNSMMTGISAETATSTAMEVFDMLDKKEADILEKKVQDRMNDVIQDGIDDWRKYSKDVIEKFFKKFPELKERDLGQVKDMAYKDSGAVETLATKVTAAVEQASPQLVDEIKKSISSQPGATAVTTEATEAYVGELGRRAVEAPMVFPDGTVIQPLIEQLSNQFQLDLSNNEQATLQTALNKADSDALALEPQLAAARKRNDTEKSAESQAALDKLLKEKADREAQRKATQEQLDAAKASGSEFKRRADEAGTEEQHAAEELKKGK